MRQPVQHLMKNSSIYYPWSIHMSLHCCLKLNPWDLLNITCSGRQNFEPSTNLPGTHWWESLILLTNRQPAMRQIFLEPAVPEFLGATPILILRTIKLLKNPKVQIRHIWCWLPMTIWTFLHWRIFWKSHPTHLAAPCAARDQLVHLYGLTDVLQTHVVRRITNKCDWKWICLLLGS